MGIGRTKVLPFFLMEIICLTDKINIDKRKVMAYNKYAKEGRDSNEAK